MRRGRAGEAGGGTGSPFRRPPSRLRPSPVDEITVGSGETGERSLYDPIARFYDLDHAGFDEDLPFYREFARAAAGPLLDVGVGTGRVALALAAEGWPVTGVDPSTAMLVRARARAEAAGLADRLALVAGDAATVALPERFGLAYFALNTFSHLLTRPEQLAALANVRRYLREGGRLVIDQWNPHASSAPDSSGQWVLGYRRRDAAGRWVTQSVASTADPAEQVLRTTIAYDVEAAPARRAERDTAVPGRGEGGANVGRTTIELRLRYFYRFEVEWLLLAAGYDLEAVFGGYDLAPYAAGSPRLIWLARHRAAP